MSNLSRRQFLEQSLFATASLAMANASRTFAADDVKPEDTKDKLRVAVVGVKGRGGSHIGGFGKHPECEIAALVDVDETYLNI